MKVKMNNLQKQQLIIRENLDEEHYFQSIIDTAHGLGLLSDSELENIQMQGIKLLARQTERYTGGDSSSVRVETAQCILQSVLFSIGVYLKSLPETDMGLQQIKQTPLAELLQHGRKLIEKKVNISRHILHLIQSDHISNDNIAYNDTIENGLPGFFSTYDVDYAAHETTGSIDYPLNIDKMELVGIEYIYNYLQTLYWENKFCKKFSAHDIECVMRGYDEQYEDLLVNIFRIVFTNALGCILSNRSTVHLDVGQTGRQYIKKQLKNLPTEELHEVLSKASIKLCRELDITNAFFMEYISLTLEELCERLKNALDNDHLESVFVSHREKVCKPVIHFMDGDKMDDEAFRRLATEIGECRFVSDKISIIMKEIHSISDLVDILEGDCLFGNEFNEFFDALGDNELAMLSNLLPKKKVDSNLAESGKGWYVKMDEYLEGLDLNRKNSISNIADKIELC